MSGGADVAGPALLALVEKHEAGAVNLGRAFSHSVADATTLFFQAMKISGNTLATAASTPKPADPMSLVKPIQEMSPKLEDLGKNAAGKENVPAEVMKYLTGIFSASFFPALVDSPPAEHVAGAQDGADFYGVKIANLKNEKFTAWLRAVQAFVKDVLVMLKAEFGPGGKIKWGLAGGGGGGSPARPQGAAAGGGAPAKGPGPSGGGPPAAPGGLLAGLGEAANNLRKVQAHEKNKNRPKEETSAVVPAAAAGNNFQPNNRNQSGGVKKIGQPRGPPRKELEQDRNWIVENYDSGLVELADTNQKQSVYISNSNNCTAMNRHPAAGTTSARERFTLARCR